MILPLQSELDRSSGPTSQGFAVNVVSYSPKIRQVAFAAPSQEAARSEEWMVTWKLLVKRTAQEVIDTGLESTYDTIKDFYETNYLGTVEWTPVEIGVARVWEIIPDSFKQKNRAGSVFEASFKIRFLYNA